MTTRNFVSSVPQISTRQLTILQKLGYGSFRKKTINWEMKLSEFNQKIYRKRSFEGTPLTRASTIPNFFYPFFKRNEVWLIQLLKSINYRAVISRSTERFCQTWMSFDWSRAVSTSFRYYNTISLAQSFKKVYPLTHRFLPLPNCTHFKFKECENVLISIKSDFPKVAIVNTSQERLDFFNRKN